ncbi:MAG: hypothetical protein HOO97_01660 [Sideroxydans sp.]|nr:hypothetical protein [Sideroxydans sp.]
MKITVQIDGGFTTELPHADFANFIGLLEDAPIYANFYEALAAHPSSQIRAEVASKTCLLVDTYERLAQDSSIEVVRRFMGNTAALLSISTETLKTMIGRDISIASELVSWGVDEMDTERRGIVITELIKYDDPIIRDAIANLID